MSNINYASINENFPIAGQDNDTQTFRDNFDTIKTSLRYAFEEVTDLQDNTARTDQDNDFNNKLITRAVFQHNRESYFDGGALAVPITVDFENGNYQKYRFGANLVVSFLNFPTILSNPEGIGRVFLELYGDNTPRTITLDPSAGTVYKKGSWDAGWAAGSFIVTSSTNPLILEVWSYNSSTYFIKNHGVFS